MNTANTNRPTITVNDIVCNTDNYRMALIANAATRRARVDATFEANMRAAMHVKGKYPGKLADLAVEFAQKAISMGLDLPRRDFIRPGDLHVIQSKLHNHTAMTEKEQKIVSLIREIDTLAEKMNSMMPIAVESANLKVWTQMKEQHWGLLNELDEAADAYIAEQVTIEPSVWQYVYKKNLECCKAIESVTALFRDNRISAEERQTICAPIKTELNNTRRFTIHKIVEKHDETSND